MVSKVYEAETLAVRIISEMPNIDFKCQVILLNGNTGGFLCTNQYEGL